MQQVYIALLRGINVSGKNKISMIRLTAIFEQLGLENVQTYIQSGNVIFTSNNLDLDGLKKNIETSLKEEFQSEVPVFVMKGEALLEVHDANPFLSQPGIELSKLHITFLENKTGAPIDVHIDHTVYEPDKLIVISNLVYIFCPNGYGVTKLNNVFFERKFKCNATTRGWNTVVNLLKKLDSYP